MSDVPNRVLMQADTYMPENDDDEQMDVIEKQAIFESSMVDIIENIGEITFKNTYIDLLPDIQKETFKNRRIFCQRILERVSDVYDFTFPTILDITTETDIDNIHKFIEFIEYDNVLFLSLVWEMLKVNLMKIDIETFCKRNATKIIKEIDEQLETHYQNELITIFLRTYYKEKFIEWFIRESQRSRVFIQLEILEREGKLNG